MDAPQTNGARASPAAPAVPTPPQAQVAIPSQPALSTQIPSTDKRPRDARLIHLLLSNLGITAYQERVPLQLLDFSYRHTSALLSDSLHLSSDAYMSQVSRAKEAVPGRGGNADGDGGITMSAVNLAIQSRLQYQLGGGKGGNKEYLMEVAAERNKIALPRVGQTEWGVRLPAEKFVLTGVPWGLKEEWEGESSGDEKEKEKDGGGDVEMKDQEESMFGDDVEGGTMEEAFGYVDDVDAEMAD